MSTSWLISRSFLKRIKASEVHTIMAVSTATHMDVPDTVDILVKGCDVVTMDKSGAVLADAAIAIAGGRIVWIGPSAGASILPKAASVIDGSGRIALPGLIDAHVHTAQ